jgi:hypothetical protein
VSGEVLGQHLGELVSVRVDLVEGAGVADHSVSVIADGAGMVGNAVT